MGSKEGYQYIQVKAGKIEKLVLEAVLYLRTETGEDPTYNDIWEHLKSKGYNYQAHTISVRCTNLRTEGLITSYHAKGLLSDRNKLTGLGRRFLKALFEENVIPEVYRVATA